VVRSGTCFARIANLTGELERVVWPVTYCRSLVSFAKSGSTTWNRWWKGLVWWKAKE